MTLEEVKILIQLILDHPKSEARKHLKDALDLGGKKIGQFYDGVIEHREALGLTSEQWLDFHLKVNHWRLLRERSLMDKLSPAQQEKLGIA